MDIVHAVENDASDFLWTLVRTHDRNGVALYEDITFCKKLNSLVKSQRHYQVYMAFSTYLQCAPIRSNNPLSPLDKSLLIPNDTSNLDDITRNPILQNLDCLRGIDSSRQ